MNIGELRKSLDQSRQALRVERDRLSETIARLDQFCLDADEPTIEATEQAPAAAPQPKRTQRTTSVGIAELAHQILSTYGKMTTPGLLMSMKNSGHPVRGKRPIQTLYGVLHKDAKSAHPRVSRNKAGFWSAIENGK